MVSCPLLDDGGHISCFSPKPFIMVNGLETITNVNNIGNVSNDTEKTLGEVGDIEFADK